MSATSVAANNARGSSGRVAPIHSSSPATLQRICEVLGGVATNHSDVEFIHSRDGCISMFKPYANPKGVELLERHTDWAGPIKLELRDSQVVQRIDVQAVGLLNSAADEFAADDERAASQDLLGSLLDCASGFFSVRSEIKGWTPPEASAIRGWLAEAGIEAAIDKDEHIRLTIKRRGLTGQARIERRQGRLRLILPLGRWRGLDPVSERAILLLAGEANERGRLARIAWLEREGVRCCEAQVDLTGLPAGAAGDGPLSAARDTMWKETIRAAVAGLGLALARLGLEVEALGDPKNKSIAKEVALQLKDRS